MSYKIKVKYLNNLGKVSSYFWTRAIRNMPNGRYGVNISGKVYPLYRGNFINHDDKNDLSLKECPITETNEAKEAVEQLPLLDGKFSELVGKNIRDQVILKENNDNSITVQVDGKEYDVDKLPNELRNYIVARQEIQQSKVRHEIELEKIDVLTNYYNGKIQEGVKQFNGGDSKS